MELNLEWANPIPLKALDMAPATRSTRTNCHRASGVYVFARRFGSTIEALYVGQAQDIR